MGMDLALRRKVPRRSPATRFWLLPLRDILSVAEIATSYWVEAVIWRGHRMDANGIAAGPLTARVGSVAG